MQSPSSSFTAANSAFFSFLRENGAEVSPSIDIHDYSAEHAGRGIIATADMENAHTLFTLPLSVCLSHRSSRAAPWIAAHPDLFDHGWAPAILAVMYELVHADSSKWKPYFDILPVSFDTPVFWPESDLALLAGTDLPRRMSLEESKSLFQNVLLPIIQEHASDEDIPKFTLDKFMYAGSLLMAYGFHIGSLIGAPEEEEDEGEDDDVENADEGLPVIVPLADTLNAVHPPSAHLERDPKKPDVLVMRTSTAVSKGCQVFNTYGDHGSNELLRRYGYIEWTNEFDSVVVEGPTVVQAVATAVRESWAKGLSDDKLESVLEKRVDDLAEFDVYDDEFELSIVRPVPADLVLTIKLLLLSPDEYKRAKKHPHLTFPTLAHYTQADPSDRVLGAPIHLTAAESAVLVQVVKERLDEYPDSEAANACSRILSESKSLAEFLSRVCNDVPNGSVRMAYACYVRESERRLLQAVLSRVEEARKVQQWPASEKEAVEKGGDCEAEAVIVLVDGPYVGLVKESTAASGKKDKKKRGPDASAPSSSASSKRAKKST